MALDPDFEAPLRAHRQVLVFFLGVAPVTVSATDRVPVMHVILESNACAFDDAVALETGILGGRVGALFDL